jgi:hypothetical protein
MRDRVMYRQKSSKHRAKWRPGQRPKADRRIEERRFRNESKLLVIVGLDERLGHSPNRLDRWS